MYTFTLAVLFEPVKGKIIGFADLGDAHMPRKPLDSFWIPKATLQGGGQ